MPTSPGSSGCSRTTNELQIELRRVSAFLYALTTTDSRDDRAAASQVELQTHSAPLAPLIKRLGAWVAALGVDHLTAKSLTAAEHEFALQTAADLADLQMTELEESLAADLAPSGPLAWQRLHGDVSSQLMVDVRAADGTVASVPMALARGLATDADAFVRRSAYEGELAAWSTVAVPLAAALNGAKGALGVLNRRRGFPDDLEPALRTNNVERGDAQRDDGGRRRVTPRASAATCAPRLGCSVTATVGSRGGTCSRRSGARPTRRGRARPTACTTRSRASRPILRGWRRARSTSAGSTPRSATGNAEAPTASASTTTSAA